MAQTIEQAIKDGKSRVFRRAFIKRRLAISGLFEDDWLDISTDVMKWGSVRVSSDETFYGKLTLEAVRMQMDNNAGSYNSESDPNSLWYGFASIQRTLLKIETGFLDQTQSAAGQWTVGEFPTPGAWDDPGSLWDSEVWDANGSQVFVGLIAGEMTVSDEGLVTLNVKPLTQVFKDFPAQNLTGYNSSLTASGFMQILRDQTDGSGSFLFRPFFGDTTTYWNITATTNVYSQLDTGTAQDVINASVWDIVEKLAESENYMAYVDRYGLFNFTPKTPSSTVAFHFHGRGSFDSTYGHTIKKISSYGENFNNYYSRVQIKFGADDTATSYYSKEGTLLVAGNNAIWNLGFRTFSMENLWLPNTAAAQAIATTVFNELSSLQNRIEFSTSFIPHLSILDRIQISYDSTTRAQTDELWDLNDWDTELTWDSSKGNAIIIEGAEFKFLSVEIDLDNFECKFIGRSI